MARRARLAPHYVIPPPRTGVAPLSADAEPRDEAAVSVDVVVPDVIEKTPPTTDELHETAARVMIAAMQPEMLGQVVNPLGENRYLHLGRAGVTLVEPVLGDRCRLIGHA